MILGLFSYLYTSTSMSVYVNVLKSLKMFSKLFTVTTCLKLHSILVYMDVIRGLFFKKYLFSEWDIQRQSVTKET